MENSKSRPVLIWVSVLAGVQTFLAGATTVSIVAESYLAAQVIALSMVAVSAAQFGIKKYLEGAVTPNDAVVERATPSGVVVAGEANEWVAPGTPIRDVGETPRQQREVLGGAV